MKVTEIKEMRYNPGYSKTALSANLKIKERDYWLNKLSGGLEKSCFPPDFPESKKSSELRKEKFICRFPNESFSKLIKVSSESDRKMHVILASGLVVLLHIYTGNEDIVIGTPIYKQKIETDFINTTLILRSYIQEHITFRELLIQMKQTIVDAIENRNYPVEILAEKLNKPYSPGSDFPFFDVAMVVPTIHDKSYLHSIKHNMTFSFLKTREYVEFELEYNPQRYRETTIQRIIRHFIQLLNEVLDNLGIRLSQIDILSQQEKKQTLFDFNDTKTGYPRNKTIHQLFEEQAERIPDNIAVVGMGNGAWGMYLTYSTLNETSHQLAHLLWERGVTSDTIVAIMLEPAIEMVTSMLAVLKAGGAYLPIDSLHPRERIAYILKDSNALLLLTQTDLRKQVGLKWEILDVGNINLCRDTSGHPDNFRSSSNDSAYVIYTSGSTGKPKGVIIEHNGMSNLKVFHKSCFQVDEKDRIIQFASSSFDASVWEIYMALLNGAALYMLSKEIIGDYGEFEAYMTRNEITIATLPPIYANYLNPDQLKSLRILITAGSAPSFGLVNKWRKKVEYINAYGPTESTICATAWNAGVKSHALHVIPIGKPITNTRIYIFDTNLNIQPIGVLGELCISGVGLARGYLNRPELTAEKFCHWQPGAFLERTDPIRETSAKNFLLEGTRGLAPLLYRTGDLARWLPDGNIEFIGRMDYQAKISGFRIECSEIENQLLTHEKIKEAVALVKTDESGDKYICTYIVSEENLAVKEIKEYLSKHLPRYMIPSYIMQIEKIPLTASGKTDRKALPTPKIIPGSEYVAPGNAVEKKLVQLWSEVLLIENSAIGIDNNFFELGGHSLKATILVSKIHKALNVKLPLAEIFRTPTIRELAQYINEAEEDKYAEIVPVEKKEYYALSSAQQRLYVLQLMEMENTAYNIPEVISLSREPDARKLEKTFIQLIQRHESLRTSFHMVSNEPVQEVHDTVKFKVEYYETRIHSLSVIRQRFDSTFDLSKAPLLKVGIVKTGEREYILVVVMHHIVSDGVSHEILVKDFMALDEGKELPALRIQYKDFSQWQNSRKEKEKIKQQEAYWLKEFAGEIPVLNIPTDFLRPIIQSFEGSTVSFEIGSLETQLLKTNARQEGVTVFILLLAIINIWLAKNSNQEDIVIGTPIAGRRHADLEKIIGMFINTLAMRNHPQNEKNFNDFLNCVKKTTLEAFENQDYQFEDLVEKISVNRDTSRNPLLDVMFEMQNLDTPPPDPPARKKTREETIPPQESRDTNYQRFEMGTAKFDIVLHCVETSEKLYFSFEYSTKLFKKETIHRFIFYFKKIVSLVVSKPNIQLRQIEVISGEEKKQLLYDFNDIGANYPVNKTIHQLFEEQVERTPDNIAVIGTNQLHERASSEGTRGPAPLSVLMSITYKELNKKSHQLAHLLMEKGVKPDTIVGIMVEPSLEMIIGILVILKAGGAYLPIDPEYPKERINYMLADSSAGVLVTTPGLSKKIEKFSIVNCQLLMVNEKPSDRRRLKIPPKEANSINNYQLTIHNSQLNSSNLAYIIYTSGTTGKPKGTLIHHRNVVRLMFHDGYLFYFDCQDVWTMFHSYCFDFSVWEMYGALLYGGKLVLIPKITARDTQKFREILEKEKVTILNQTPAAFYNLANLELQRPGKKLNLKYVIFGGDALKPTKLKNWKRKYPETKLINMFGITETTVHVTFKELEDTDIESKVSNIGKPLPTLSTYVMDKNQKLVPMGVVGELCVGGEGVGKGYLNRPELTKRKFVDNPYIPDQKLYKSGDLGKFLENGNLEYLGRIDYQVKIRGFRVETEEIEYQLLKYHKIKEAVVIARQTTGGNSDEDEAHHRYLCAYIVQKSEPIPSNELKEYLSNDLPGYMIPSYFVQIDHIPLTANGKVDRRALPKPEIEIGEYIAPRNDLEQTIADIWKRVLGLENISMKDSYFNVGGDSIKAIKVLSIINAELNTDLTIIDLFTNETIEKLSNRITQSKRTHRADDLEEARKEIETLKSKLLTQDKFPEPENIEDIYPMSDIERGMVFHLLKEPERAIYHDQMVHQMTYPDFSPGRFKKAVERMKEKHPILRTGFNVSDFEEPVQIVYKDISIDIVHDDVSNMDRHHQEEYIRKLITRDRQLPFNVLKPPLWRIKTFALDKDNIVVLWVCHHAIMDGWSDASFKTELHNIYLELAANPEFIPPKLKSSYKEFVIEQIAQKKNESILRYWRNELQDYKRLEFPGTVQSKGVPASMNNYLSDLGIPLLNHLKEAAVKYNTNLKHLCFAAYLYMLNMLSYESDITVGLVTNNRPVCEDGERILGCFLNTIPVRVKIPDNINWNDYIHIIDRKLIELAAYDRLSLFEIVRLTGEVAQNQNPIFDTLFNFVDFHIYQEANRQKISQTRQDSRDPGFSLSGQVTANTLLDFSINTTLGGFDVSISYSPTLFDKETALNLFGYFKAVLNKFINEPESTAAKHRLIGEEEKQKLLVTFNFKETGYAENKAIHELFAEQTKITPDNIAAVGQSAKRPAQSIEEYDAPCAMRLAISYRELNHKSDQLARLLKIKGAGPDVIIAIMMEQSIEMFIGLLAILKAGSAFLPIDPYYPAERIKYILLDSNAKILLHHSSNGSKVYEADEVIELNPELYNSPLERGAPKGRGMSKPATRNPQLAYIIYTSGSTGKPKGTAIQHQSLSNLCHWHNKRYAVTANDRATKYAGFGFDASVWEIFPYLIRGAAIYIVDKEIKSDILRLNHFFEENRITISFLPTQLCEQFMTLTNRSLRTLLTGGDQLKSYSKRDYQLVNNYGPTENTVVSTSFTVDGEYTNIPIGKPIDNIRLYVLNKHLQLQPVGVPGELCISGIGLARGYLNRPELTAEKFCLRRARCFTGTLFEKTAPPGPPRKNFPLKGSHKDHIQLCNYATMQLSSYHSHHYPIYLTGDLTRWLPDGNIQFLGRIDHQVKIRGYRIEPGEIESHLLKHKEIKDAVVMARDDNEGDKYLCAYIVAQHEAHGAWRKELRESLSKTLPDYMIPAYFIPIEKIPLTPGGKIDRRNLSTPVIQSSVSFTAPRDEIEEKLAKIWTEVLKAPISIGINDNFFELGGHSLTATILAARIHKELDVTIPLKEIFKYPTIRELNQYIRNTAENKYIFIHPTEKKEYYRLSSAQKRLYLLQDMIGENTAYNITEIIPLYSKTDILRLEETIRKLVNLHESLRTSFHKVADEPAQRIHDEVEFEIEYYDLTTEVTENTEEAGSRTPHHSSFITHHSFVRPFDLSQAPLLRVGLIKPPHTPSALRSYPSQEGRENKYLLIVDMHHIISDGISHGILVKNFTALYEGKTLFPLRIQYKDFSEWQNSSAIKELIKYRENYWLREFGEDIPVLDLPTDYPRPLIQSFEGNTINFEIAGDQTSLLKNQALDKHATLYMILSAILNILLSKLSNQEDIVIGTAAAGRRHADLEQIIGMFVNTLPLRNYPHGEKNFTQFLEEVKERTLEAFENQEYPFEDLVDKLTIKRDPARNPLFDIMFVLQNTGRPREDTIPTLPSNKRKSNVNRLMYQNKTSKFDLTLNGVESQGKLVFSLEYSTKLFKKTTIEKFLAYLKRIVDTVIIHPHIKISEIEIISSDEKRRILFDFNDTQKRYPRNKTIHELFEVQAKQIPGHIAAVEIENNSQVSYKTLNKKANQLAVHLVSNGVKIEESVGIMAEHSLEMVVGVLAVLKAGGSYLPINPEYPEERKKYLLKDSSAKTLLTNYKDCGALAQHVTVIPLEDPGIYTGTFGEVEIRNEYPCNNLAYIIYTSGSTGEPKGVMVGHRNVVRLVKNTNYLEFRKRDHLLQTGALEFDASTFEISGSLLNGLVLYLAVKDKILAPETLKEIIQKNEITTMWLTSSLFNQLLDAEIEIFSGLRNLLVGGEALSPIHINLARTRFPCLNIINGYGPTENTTFSCTCQVNTEHEKNIPIGKPIANSTSYIVDKYNYFAPVGIVGELLVGGDGVARGYLNNPELTAEKFDHDLWDYQDYHDEKNKSFCRGSRGRFFQKEPPGRRRQKTYRTGDLAKWLPDGNIEFLGRIDRQVKIRGFRIEPGEIEKRLMELNAIKKAVVTVQEKREKEKYLCAYVVASQELNISQLKTFLSLNLPSYMIPSYFVKIEKIPLTPNGKIDYNALPSIKVKSGDEYEAPQDEIEKKLVGIWSKVLEIETHIGTNDNFFELGGHSLKAAMLVSEIHGEFDITVPLLEVFVAPTIKQLAQYIRITETRSFTIKDENLELLRKKSNTANHLFFVHDGTGQVEGYIELCNHLNGEFNCWGIRADRLKNYAPQNITIQELAKKYIRKIKKIQPRGPYFIIGWSLGGTIAFEMTCQIEYSGEKPGFLVLIDTTPPASDSLTTGTKFTGKSELNVIYAWLNRKELKQQLKNANEITQIWQQVVDYLEKSKIDTDGLKRVKEIIPQGIVLAIPSTAQSNLRESIYYVNMIRTLDNARTNYVPQRKSHSITHFFAASESKIINKNHWGNYFHKTLAFHKINGDHFSILKIPDVISFAKQFDRVVKYSMPLKNVKKEILHR